MFQLVFMQFNLMQETNLTQGELSTIAITGSESDYQRYPLIGGGSVLVKDQRSNLKKFIDFGNLSAKKLISIAVDEDASN